MPARLKLILAYDGAPFAGWQSQAHTNTVQDRLEHAFARVSGKPVRVHGAGRTDAGVHALGQCAHADVADRRLESSEWLGALNNILPPAIRVLRCNYVADHFHARHSALGKTYRYILWMGKVLPPFYHRRAWQVLRPVDIASMAVAAREFEGEHDFAAFAANRGKPVESTLRNIRSVHIRTAGRRVAIDFDGDGFLYKMVRLMVGTLVRVGTGRGTADDIRRQLRAHRDAAYKPNRHAAPADGLILVRVRY